MLAIRPCRSAWLVLLVACLALLASCAELGPPVEGPLEVVRRFVAASAGRDLGAMLERVEPVEWRKQVVPELEQALAQIESLSYVDPRFELLDDDGGLAHVRFQATARLKLRGQEAPFERAIDRTFELVRLEGRWYIRSLTPPVAAPASSGFAATAWAAEAQPNDPRFGEQWALMQVRALCAWGYTQGTARVTVAVVDSGVDPGHPDLQGRLRGDGYDFVANDGDPRDENGHGTNVAGIIAAVANNGEGIAGLAPQVQILPLRVVDAQGYGDEQQIASGIRYAADKGAQVINLSLGASLYLASGRESSAVSAAIGYAQRQGALVVAAAGNDFVPAPNIVGANNADVLVVAASDQQDRKAPFSNFGPWIAVTAPGVAILSTMPTYEVTLTSPARPAVQRFAQGYDRMSGTSQAAPMVSALAALLFALHPDWSAAQVGATIRSSAADIYALNPEFAAGKQLGSGRINACAALGGAARTPVVTATAPLAGATPPPLLLLAGLLLVVLALLVLGGLRLFRSMVPVPVISAAQPVPLSDAQPPRRNPVPSAQPALAVRPEMGWGELRLLAGPVAPRRYPLRGAALTLGRADDCELLLEGDQAVSRRHLRLRLAGSRVLLEDLGSTHGTYLNGQRIEGLATLRDGDLLQVGHSRLEYRRS